MSTAYIPGGFACSSLYNPLRYSNTVAPLQPSPTGTTAYLYRRRDMGQAVVVSRLHSGYEMVFDVRGRAHREKDPVRPSFHRTEQYRSILGLHTIPASICPKSTGNVYFLPFGREGKEMHKDGT
jgi:hypothetical protein